MENRNNKLKAYIDNLIALRAVYYSIIVVLTSGLFGLFYNMNNINIIIFIVGILIELYFILKVKRISSLILKLIHKIKD